ncbi:hypothetical protein M0804_006605 [Polistes exclamans]|nr:hypothetical protein M0804_006605 [Polistes exclamans]
MGEGETSKVPGEVADLLKRWASARRVLGAAIKRAKERCWRELTLSVEGDVKGIASSFRTIRLISGLVKLYERVIVNRFNAFLESNLLLSSQFGFKVGRSTIDTIAEVRRVVECNLKRGLITVMISLDIANVFNSLRWCVINDNIASMNVPEYLRSIIRRYLSKRWLMFPASMRTTFYVTQLMTGHGCFPGYLSRICRARSARFFHCA